MPTPSQNRHHLTAALQDHGQRDAATLVNTQIHPSTLTEAATIGDSISVDVDLVLGDATDAAFNASLPLGSEAIIGHAYAARKTDASANAFGLALQGSDTFEGGGTTLTTTTRYGQVAAMWDGTIWRILSAGTSGALPSGSSLTLGNGTGSPALTMNKVNAGTDGISMQNAGALRGELLLDGSEKFILRNYAADGTTVLGSLTFDNASGLLTSLLGVVITAGGLTITAGGLTVTAGGASIVAGNLALTAGVRAVLNAPAAADDAAAAALSPTVPVGGAYHVSGALKQRLV